MLFQITLPICLIFILKQNKPDKALEYASRSLKLAQKIRTQETNKHFK
jgi:hypothetical protein